MRLFLNPYATARMLLEEEYSRSDRFSELLDDYFYDGLALTSGLRLKDIHITPLTADKYLDNGKFSAHTHNRLIGKEDCKIPILTINATCLNTGHPFHFTGSWVGEPARQYDLEQNSNFVLPQLRFDGHYNDGSGRKVEDWQLEKMCTLTLADAVAASAAVPGIFTPLPIHNLYRNGRGDEIVVELSDGGVFDNQGLDALLVAQCTHVIISDACGQLEDELLLATDPVHTVQRANNVMMERIRGHNYFDLRFRQDIYHEVVPHSSHPAFPLNFCFIRISAFMHLREEAANTVDMPALPGPVNQPGGLIYRLSSVRTDLDAFSDLEADVLMYQGYVLTHRKIVESKFNSKRDSEPCRQWEFLKIREVLKSQNGLYRLNKHLTVGKKQFGKGFYLTPCKSWAWLIFLMSPILLWLVIWLCENWRAPVILPNLGMTWGGLVLKAFLLLIVIAPISPKVRGLFKTISGLRAVKENPITDNAATVFRFILMVVALISSLLVFVWLSIYNRIFLEAGKLTAKG